MHIDWGSLMGRDELHDDLRLCHLFYARCISPYGEMGLPQRFSGSVIAMASFIVYLPSSFAYLLWALILDGSPARRVMR